jgi:hypothetical protein
MFLERHAWENSTSAVWCQLGENSPC